MLKYVPNILTIIRFILIPIIVISLFSGNYILSFIFILLSAITDMADGFIARKYDLISNFGKLMDPLADKLTLLSILTSLAILHILPLWILIIVAVKEFSLVTGSIFLYEKDIVVYSKWYGKVATVLFYLAIGTTVLSKAFNLPEIFNYLDLILYCIALLMSVIALILYVRINLVKNLKKNVSE